MKRLLQIFFHIDKTRYFEKLSENDPHQTKQGVLNVWVKKLT
jgi:hypothetical protein